MFPSTSRSEAFFHLTANISYPLMVLLSTMLLPAMIVRFYQGWFQMLVIDLPLFLASTCSISSFYLAAQKELRPKTWMSTFLYMPFVMATGIGFSVRNAQAVLEAIFGKKSEFARTPKFKIEGKYGTFAAKKYKNKSGWMPYFEIALGLYFAAHRRFFRQQRKLRHRPVPSPLCLGLSLHRPHVPQPILVRPSPLRRQRPRNAPRLFRRPRLLTSLPGAPL